MTVENQEGAVPPVGGTPPAGAPPAVPPAGGSPPGQQPLPGVTPPAGVAGAAGAADPDDETPDSKGWIKLPAREFKKRVAKAYKKDLRALFGTDDPKAIQKMKERFDAYETAEKERERAQMDAKQRYEADIKAANERAEKAERKAQRAKDRVYVNRQEKTIRGIVSQHIHHEHLDRLIDMFAARVASSSSFAKKHDVARTKGRARVEAWIKEQITAVPAFAKTAAPPAPGDPPAAGAPAGEPVPPKPPITNGIGGPKTRDQQKPVGGGVGLDANGLYKGKTPRPNQPNSMNKEELNEFTKAMGYGEGWGSGDARI